MSYRALMLEVNDVVHTMTPAGELRFWAVRPDGAVAEVQVDDLTIEGTLRNPAAS